MQSWVFGTARAHAGRVQVPGRLLDDEDVNFNIMQASALQGNSRWSRHAGLECLAFLVWWTTAKCRLSSHTTGAPACCSRGDSCASAVHFVAWHTLLRCTRALYAGAHRMAPGFGGGVGTVLNWDASLQSEDAAATHCSPHIRGKAVGLLGQYLWRHEARGANHALVLLASVLSRGCQAKVTCSRAGRSATYGGTDSVEKAGAAESPAVSTHVLLGVRVWP